MIDTNTEIAKFIAQNCVGLWMIHGLLKVLARRSKNVVDDSLVGLFGSWLPKKKSASTNNDTPPPSDSQE